MFLLQTTNINEVMLYRYLSKTCTLQQHDTSEPTASTRHRRVTLKYGRARRKRCKSIHRIDNLSSADTAEEGAAKNSFKGGESDDSTENTTNNIPKDNISKEDNSQVFTGNLLRDRYIRSLQPIHYPKTMKGWKEIFHTTWDKYLWTFEGFIRKETNIKRDSQGNILEEDENENDDTSKKEKDKSLQDQATEVAGEVASNVQKNISTIKEEAPKLLQLGQQITGVSTKEELREWVGEQLKLGTACLSQFMRGYRKGRDDEVDRMLHEYFKDLDKQTEPDGKTADESLNNQDGENDDNTNKHAKRFTWGRRERRRLKSRRDITLDASESATLADRIEVKE